MNLILRHGFLGYMLLLTLVRANLVFRKCKVISSLIFAGYAGFHPPRPGQDEDVLSAANVKHGFILAHPVLVSIDVSVDAAVITMYFSLGRNIQRAIYDQRKPS